MSRSVGFCVVSLWLLVMRWGCGAMNHNAGEPIQQLLNVNYMKYQLETERIDLSAGGNCPGTVPVKVVNAEKDARQHVFFENAGHDHYLLPIEFMGLVKRYMEKVFAESKLTVDAQKGRSILVSFEDAQVEGWVVPEGTVKIKIEIPDINYVHTYTGIEGSGSAYHTVAYGVHLVVDQLIKDPVFQKFVQCQ